MKKGFLKNFSRYKKKGLSLYDRFIKPEEKDTEWGKKFFEAKESKGIAGFFQFAKYFYSSKIDVYSTDLIYLIQNFTLDK